MSDETGIRVGTVKDVQKITGASPNKIYEMAQTGEIPTLRRIGPRLRFDLDEVERWMRKAAQS